MNISIIEFGVYGFICYFSLAMLISSVHKEIPGGKITALSRSIFMIPGIICAGILTWTGVIITLENGTVGNIIKNLNDTSTWSEVATTTSSIILVNPIWITVHFMIFIIMIVYFLTQIFILLTAKPESNTNV